MQNRIDEFNETLFAWSDENWFPMDWRTKKRDQAKGLDPYRVLVSEVMLQQTYVARVKEKFKEFVERFPDVDSLAAAPLGDVLRLWSGLGYNRRAKFLHDCAKSVVVNYEGKFPRDFKELQKLPGVGISTAAAIMAFAHNESYPMIDTNVRRVLARTFFDGKPPSDKELLAFAVEIIPGGRGRAWNYAMLDLAREVCTARDHKESCPLFDLHGEVGDFVYKKPQSKFKGSKRSYRAALVRALVKGEKLTRENAEGFFKETPYDGRLAVDELISEGLIAQKKNIITLP